MKTSFLKLSFLGVFLFQLPNIYSQEKTPVSFGKVSADDFNVNSQLVDANSSAVIIADVGDTKFEGNNKGWFMYVYKRQTRIKILDKKAYDLATVKILLYRNENGQEKVDHLDAVTYNIENGKVSATNLASEDVFDEKVDKNHLYKKFSMPGVKAGSIIEYTYTIKSDFEFNLPSWEFQNERCPTLWSEYHLILPALLSYMSFFQGYHKFYINEKSEGRRNYLVRRPRKAVIYAMADDDEKLTVSSTTTTYRWVKKDLPAFGVENYIASAANYIDKISLQLYKTYDGENYHDVINTWQKVTEQLMEREDFGLSFKKGNQWMDEILQQFIKPGDTKMEVAKRIFYYIQHNYTCTDYDNKFIKTTLQDVVKKKSGTVGDINLLLIALLKGGSIEAEPVLLSTKAAGRNSPAYPMMERLNYVICQAKIDGSDYYLDATRPFLGFGKLPLDCYNGHARVISKDTAAVYFLTDSLKETNLVNVFISNTDKNEIEGAYNKTMGFFGSLNTKNEIAKSTLSVYKSGIKALYPEDVLISNIKVDSFLLPEEPVSLKFDFKLMAFNNAAIVYFNPMMNEALTKNPFTAAERFYPVEMPYTVDDIYLLTMDIPNGYKVDELPKPARVMLNEDEGMFEYLISAGENSIQMRCRLMIKKTNYASEDYQTLRDFYGFIVKKEAEQIVFKKIK